MRAHKNASAPVFWALQELQSQQSEATEAASAAEEKLRFETTEVRPVEKQMEVAVFWNFTHRQVGSGAVFHPL